MILSLLDLGPPHFRFYNSWLNKDGFVEMVRNVIVQVVVYGAPDKALMPVLKPLNLPLDLGYFWEKNEEP